MENAEINLSSKETFSQSPTDNAPLAVEKKGSKKNMKGIYVLIGVILLVVVAGYFGYTSYQKSAQNKSQQNQETIKIGLLLPFNGDASTIGAGALKGIQLAKKDLAADNIQIIEADGKCDKAFSPAAMNKLIAQNVIAVIGESCSGATLAALPEANKNKIVMLSPSASSADLSIPNDYFYRVVPPDSYQGKFAASLIYKKGIKKVALFYSDEPYGKGLTGIFKDAFEKLGGKIVGEVTFPRDVIALNKQVQELKALNPDAIYLVSNSLSSIGSGLRLIRATGIQAPIYGSEALKDNTVVTNANGAAEGLIVTAFPSGSAEFQQRVRANYGSDNAIYAAPQAYDALKTIYLAIQKGATTKAAMKEILPTIEFDGMSGHIKFDTNGDVTENYKYDILQVKNGQFVQISE